MSAKITDISRSVCLAITERTEKRFTGTLRVVVEINMCSGGITDAWVDTGTRQRAVGGGHDRR